MSEQSAEHPYRYFVSYSWGGGMGSSDISLAKPVRGWSDIALFAELAAQSIRRNHPYIEVGEVVIVNYQLLSGPDAGGGTAEQALRDLLSMVRQFDTPRDAGRVQAFVGDVRQVALRGLGHRRG